MRVIPTSKPNHPPRTHPSPKRVIVLSPSFAPSAWPIPIPVTKIIDNSKTILWNGPAGYFENPNFSNGSIQIAKKIIENNKTNKIFSVAGGGDTVSLLNNLNAVDSFNFVSTAGGAFLEYLEGKNLPGITALN